MDAEPEAVSRAAGEDDNSSSCRNLFAYGTLMVPRIWTLVTGLPFAAQPARLSGFACFRIEGADFPGITATGRPGDTVDGCVFEELDTDTLRRLDAYEDAFYQRHLVEVEVSRPERRSIACHTYVVPETHRSILSEDTWDLAWFQEHAMERFLSSFG